MPDDTRKPSEADAEPEAGSTKPEPLAPGTALQAIRGRGRPGQAGLEPARMAVNSDDLSPDEVKAARPAALIDVSRDGRHARERGDLSTANPYPEGSREQVVWARGYAMPDGEAAPRVEDAQLRD